MITAIPMTNKKLLLVPVILVAILIPTSAFANNGVPTSVTDLEQSFSGFEIFLNDVSSEVNANMVDISTLFTNQSQITTDLDQAELDIVSLDSRIDLIEIDNVSLAASATSTQASITDLQNGSSSLNARVTSLENVGAVSFDSVQTIDARFTDAEKFMVGGTTNSYMSSHVDGSAIVKVHGDMAVQEFRTYEVKVYKNDSVVKTCSLSSLQSINCETNNFAINEFDVIEISYKRTGGTTDTSYKVNLDAYLKTISD